jgi:hypothetical protein
MPSADFCEAVREDASALSPSPGHPADLPRSAVIPSGHRRRMYKVRPIVDGGLRSCVPTRPGRTTPPIRFVSLAPHRRSTLPSDPASRRRPGASLVLRLHAYLDGGLSPPSMTACTAHTARPEPRGVPRRLQALVSLHHLSIEHGRAFRDKLTRSFLLKFRTSPRMEGQSCPRRYRFLETAGS